MAVTLYWKPVGPVVDSTGTIRVSIQMFSDPAMTQAVAATVINLGPEMSNADMIAQAQAAVTAQCGVQARIAAAQARLAAIGGYAGGSVTA